MRFASKEELLDGAKILAAWIREKAKEQFAGHILSFAWNEFEEGGVICPTWLENGKIDFSRLNAFAKAAEYLKKELQAL